MAAVSNGMGGEINVRLLENMSKQGKGNYYYMSDPDTCGRAFANELAGLLTSVAQNIKITLTPTKNMVIEEILDDVKVDDQNGTAIISLQDIFAEETKYILVKVKTLRQDKAWARPSTICDIAVEYSNVIEGSIGSIHSSVKVTFGKHTSKTIDSDVGVQKAVIDAIKAQEEAVRLASMGNYNGARDVLEEGLRGFSGFSGISGSAGKRADMFNQGLSMSMSYVADNASFNASSNIMGANINSMKIGRASGGDYDELLSTTAQKNLQNTFTDKDNKDSKISKSNKHDKW
jgi:hypothetical protein